HAAPASAVAAADPPPAASAVGHASSRSYTVQPGDELWEVAERELGSGERWRDIVALNEGLSDVSRLAPGEVLALPTAPDGAPEVTVVVEEGDTLWHIAGAELGDPHRWPELHRANSELVQDPDVIEVGWELRVPAADAAPVAPAPAPAPPPPEAEAEAEAEAAAVGTAEDAVAEAFGWGRPVEAVTPPGAEQEPRPAAETATETPAAGAAEEDHPSDDYPGMLAPVGAALAGSVLIGVAGRRRAQVLARAMGRRLVPLPEQVAHFWTALAHRSEAPAAVVAGGPTTIVLGWDGDEPVEADLEAERALLFTGAERTAAISAVVTALSCAPASAPVELVVVGRDDWVTALDDPRVGSEPSTQAGLNRLARTCSERRLAMRQRTLASVRADADLAEAFIPTVVVFLHPLSPAELDAVGDALALGEVGVSVVAGTAMAPHLPYAPVHVEREEAVLRGRRFSPQLVTAPARRALVELFATTGSLDTQPAPWWKGDDDLPPNVHPLPRQDRPEERAMTTTLSSPSHPVLFVLGPVELRGTAGTPPTRAVGQCMEYCAWLLHNPGATPTRMLHDLQVADATRRSNMSRLRTWLGADPAGTPYLPDAYTGRIHLDDRVTSDWEQFAATLSGGINVASSQALRDALTLVRGVPLGAFAFQWQWAEQLRADMIAMIVDAACVLAERSLKYGDPETAMWAIERGRIGAPDDDVLAVLEIETLARLGRASDADHAVLMLNRALRNEGRDLEASLAVRVQGVIQTPARRALSE
ncbi:LysM peptidoglycan-binding domain-containing protein, partial [Tessaracoccus lubricantis]